MSLRERRVPLDPFEVLVRDSLKDRAGGGRPEPEVRVQLLARAARATRQERRLSWGPVQSIRDLFDDGPSHFGNSVSPHHFVSLEGLFGPRASWFSFSQLNR